MQNAILGMRTLNVTQGNYSNYSHKGINALDLAGEDTGKDVWRAKNRWKCVKVLPLALRIGNPTYNSETGVLSVTCTNDGNRTQTQDFSIPVYAII